MYALTFDDGPGPSTGELLDVLGAASVRATFFLLGRNVEQAPFCGDPEQGRALALRAARERHVLGNHTFSHLRPDRWRELKDDLRHGLAVVRGLKREAGLPDGPVPFRLPYGIRLVEQTVPCESGTVNAVALDPRLAVIASLGIGHQHWTSDFEDWKLSPHESGALSARMVQHVEGCEALGLDAVLDLHDSGTGSRFGYARPATVSAVRAFLAAARARGWQSFTV